MDNLREKTIKFLSICDGYHELCKGFHWSAEKHSDHILMDDVDSAVLEYQDKIAEVVMGMIDDKFKPGELHALVSNSKDIKSMLKEMQEDVLKFKSEIGDKPIVDALHNVLDDFLSDICKWKYLATFS